MRPATHGPSRRERRAAEKRTPAPHAAPRPAPQGISRLLHQAGFTRSNHGDPGVDLHQLTRGYRVYRTWLRDAPDEPVVAVMHVDAGQHESDRAWDAHLCITRAELRAYAAVSSAAGFATEIREVEDGELRLFVTAREAEG